MKADNLFQKMEIPLLQVVRVVKMMLGLSVVSSVLVITLLLSMWMRARKKEIGMLLSFAISPIIAETSASYLAKETQTLRLEQQEQENTGTYIDGYIAPDLKIQDVEVHITKEMVLMDIGMISGILIIAVLVAGITIMKKRPKQILSEMS